MLAFQQSFVLVLIDRVALHSLMTLQLRADLFVVKALTVWIVELFSMNVPSKQPPRLRSSTRRPVIVLTVTYALTHCLTFRLSQYCNF